MRANTHNIWLTLSAALLGLQLAGCATNVTEKITASEAHVAKYSPLTELAVVATLEKNVNEAKNIDMPFLAPHYYREAAKILGECQGSLGGKSKELLINSAAKADAILDKGRAVMAIVQYRFARELELKALLDKTNASRNYPKDYARVIAELSNRIEMVEREQPDTNVNGKETLIKDMQALEVRSIQYNALHDSEVMNEDTKNKQGEQQVPASYAEALRAHKEATERIAQAPHDEAVVQLGRNAALFAANHARQLNERVATLQKQFATGSGGPSLGLGMGVGAGQVQMSSGGTVRTGEGKMTVEKILLQEEDRLLAISTALGHKDLRDQTIDKQADEIARVAGVTAQGKDRAPVPAATAKATDDQTQELKKRLEEAQAQLAGKDAQLTELTAQLKQKDAQLGELTKASAEKDAQLKAMNDPAAKGAATAKSPTKPKSAKVKKQSIQQ